MVNETTTTTTTTTNDTVHVEENQSFDQREFGSQTESISSDTNRKPITDSDEEDHMNYNTYRKILSQPITKIKLRAFSRELLSGITVALAQVPEAVAFSFTAGVHPIIGLQAAWLGGTITSLFGGAPGMITGATGALAVVLPDFVEEYGVGYLFVAVLLMGVIQLVFGLVGGGRLVKLIGTPVMIGFCNGLAIVIGIAQLHSFKYSRYCNVPCDSPSYVWDECLVVTEPEGNNTYKCEVYVSGATAGFQALEVIVTMCVVYFLPKLTKIIPSSLAGILVGMAVEFAIVRPAGYKTPTVEDLASVKGFFPIPVWADDRYKALMPPLDEWETYRVCLPISATLAIIGLVESLMTLQLVGHITNKKPNPRAECFAQGSANVVIGIFGGMGCCAMIGQSLINVKSGGITRISGTVAGLGLLIIILAAYPVINLIPMASLAGVMFMVVIGTFEWHSLPIIFASILPEKIRKTKRFRWMRKVKRSDALIMVLVTVIAVVTNLAYAVGTGVVLAAIIFSWDQEKSLYATPIDIISDKFNNNGNTTTSAAAAADVLPKDKDVLAGVDPSDIKVYQVNGPLFFASSQKFVAMFNPYDDPDHVVLYLDNVVFDDYSALAAINQVARKYKALGKEFHIRKLGPHSLKVMKKAHHIIYTFDKTAEEDDNDEKLLAMGLAPSWEADDVPVYPNSDNKTTQQNNNSNNHENNHEKNMENGKETELTDVMTTI